MTDEDQQGPNSEVLAPGNFITFAGAGLRLFRPVWKQVTLAFLALLVTLFLIALGVAYLTSSAESQAAVAIFELVQLLALPFFGSLLMGLAGRVMVAGLVGRQPSFRSGRVFKDVRSHLLAAAMLSAFLTFCLTIALQPLGNSLATHLVLGPPVLVHAIAIERLSFTDAWARTKDIARGQGLRTFLYLLCITLVLVLVELSIGAAAYTLFANSTEGGTAALLNLPILGLVLSLVLSLGMALMTAFALAAYLDLRTRHDEIGVEEMAAEYDEGEEEQVEEEDEEPDEG